MIKSFWQKSNRKELIFLLITSLFCVVLWFLPPAKKLASPGGYTLAAKVVHADNSALIKHGLLWYGSQYLSVEILSGEFAGKIFPAVNELRASPELDKLFVQGNRIRVIISSGAEIIPEKTVLTAGNYDRSIWSFVLFGGFCLLLIIFGKWTGIKALFSFVFSCLVIFKLVIPFLIAGVPAAWTFLPV